MQQGSDIRVLFVFMLLALIILYMVVSEQERQKESLKLFAESGPSQQMQAVYQKQLELESRVNMLQALVLSK